MYIYVSQLMYSISIPHRRRRLHNHFRRLLLHLLTYEHLQFRLAHHMVHSRQRLLHRSCMRHPFNSLGLISVVRV